LIAPLNEKGPVATGTIFKTNEKPERTHDDSPRVESQALTTVDVAEILAACPTRPAYIDWVGIIAAVGSVLTESEAVAILSAWSPEESQGEYARKLRNRCQRVGIGSLIERAKCYGFDAKAFARRRADRGSVRRQTIDTPELATIVANEATARAVTKVEPVKREVLFPALRRPTCNELAQIRISRGFPVWSPLEHPVRDGMLFTATMRDGTETVEAWILTDPARRAAQARRLDGKPWVSIAAKAKTLPGSTASWPVGAALIQKYDHPVYLCEGGPDALAVEILAWLAGKQVLVVAMLGAGNRIHADALPLFCNRRIRIVEQNDDAALVAGSKWARQLHDAGARVDGWTPPAGIKDAADLLAGFAPQDEDPTADLERAAEGTELFKGMTP